MTTNGSSKTVTIRVQRFNPDVDKKPYLKAYTVQITSDTTILDALAEIKATQDGSLTFRRSCRHAICGSCAMNVNGRNTLVCNQRVNAHLDKKEELTIRPLPYLPIIKDMVVDRTSFWTQYLRVKPWLVPPDDIPEKEFRMTPEEVKALHDAEKCIMCGACYSACTVTALNKNYIGPHALLKASLRVLDPRDSITSERLVEIASADGAYRCHTIFNCIDACPKKLNPTQAIETLRKLAQKREAFVAARQERQKTL
ncbi:MAG: succinate dehydrogenase iron-sulfur subunit [Anaerolineales bacterium]|nr:succinate dehydrogenase iron-sulfur subunit [Anaerolineales bacterium]MCB8989128.1 succinate dehydrogenase iron-sulfur subunit [Ardenticatenaceae bacterium]